MAGLSFKIPNAYGKYLADILKPLPVNDYQWLIDNDEIHLLKNDEFINEFLFKKEDRLVTGDRLYNIAKSNTYYLVFVTLRAFSKDGQLQRVRTYQEFLDSDCQIAFAVNDCSYVMFWCKDGELASKMYDYTQSKGYKDVEYISEDELYKGKYFME